MLDGGDELVVGDEAAQTAPVVDQWQSLVRLTTRAMSSRSTLRSVAVPAMADS